MTFDALIFDIDRVLVDVRCSFLASANSAAKYCSASPLTPDLFYQFWWVPSFADIWYITYALCACAKNNIKEPLSKIIEKCRQNNKEDWKKTLEPVVGPFSLDTEKIKQLYQSAYSREMQNEALLIEPSLLEELSKTFKLGIATGRPRAEAEFALETFGLKKYFQSIKTLDDAPSKAERIMAVSAEIGSKKSLCVGDAVNDMLAAKAAGAAAIGVLCANENPSQELLEKQKFLLCLAGADFIVPTANEVKKCLN